MTLATTSTGLAAQLREETRVDHEQAEGSEFMTELTAGRLSIEAYAALARQLHRVYAALEQATMRYADDPQMHVFVMPELVRLPALTDDLDHLAGPSWARALPMTDAGSAYAARVAEVGATWAGGLLAHHYVRYLGDLSGGQILKRRIAEVYAVDATADRNGLTLFDFPLIPKPKPFKDSYRALMNALPWDEDERARVVEEAREAFRYNQAVFAELGSDLDRWRRPGA